MCSLNTSRAVVLQASLEDVNAALGGKTINRLEIALLKLYPKCWSRGTRLCFVADGLVISAANCL